MGLPRAAGGTPTLTAVAAPQGFINITLLRDGAGQLLLAGHPLFASPLPVPAEVGAGHPLLLYTSLPPPPSPTRAHVDFSWEERDPCPLLALAT